MFPLRNMLVYVHGLKVQIHHLLIRKCPHAGATENVSGEKMSEFNTATCATYTCYKNLKMYERNKAINEM